MNLCKKNPKLTMFKRHGIEKKKLRTVFFLYMVSIASLMLPIFCSAQIDAVVSTRNNLRLMHVDSSKIAAHEQCVMGAQKRYRYIKPLVTVCGISCVLAYFYYASSSFSGEEMDKIKEMLAQKKNADDNQQGIFQKDWVHTKLSSIGGIAVELIGGALIIPPLSELIGKLTGCAHIMSSLELYDKEYTHCNALITQMARDMQMNLVSEQAGKPMAIDARELVNATNRLVQRIEKLLGFMRVEVSKFPFRSLRKEAYAIEKRFICYTNELCADMRRVIDKTSLDCQTALELIVQFAQRYAQEMQRFNFLEQDARDSM